MKEKGAIALVDDERNILTSLRMALEAEGYKVRTYSDGVSALKALSEEPADLGIFDIKMPRMDGMELLRRVRQRSSMPVIFLTSKDEEIDELFGLKMGADDYIAKPFSQRLIVERVQAVLRRAQPKDGVRTEAVVDCGRLKLDPARHACYFCGSLVRLTADEFRLLEEFAKHPGTVRTRDALKRAKAGLHRGVQDLKGDRIIDKTIARLRKKFRRVNDTFEVIESYYSVGYRLSDQCIKAEFVGNEIDRIVERGKLKLDPKCHTCHWDSRPVTLTVTEFLILLALASRPDVVKTRDALMDAAYDDQVYVDDRTIDTHIKRLRRKFKLVDPDFGSIETLYGVGYRFVGDEQFSSSA